MEKLIEIPEALLTKRQKKLLQVMAYLRDNPMSSLTATGKALRISTSHIHHLWNEILKAYDVHLIFIKKGLK